MSCITFVCADESIQKVENDWNESILFELLYDQSIELGCNKDLRNARK